MEVSLGGFRQILAASLSLLAFLGFLGYLPTPSQAHSMTFLSWSFMEPCLSPGTSLSYSFYSNVGPSDKTWVIRVFFGIYAPGPNDETDTVQNLGFKLWVIDHAITAEVAAYREGDLEWHSTTEWVRATTLTAHVGGTLDVSGIAYNVDTIGKPQCISFWVRAAYM